MFKKRRLISLAIIAILTLAGTSGAADEGPSSETFATAMPQIGDILKVIDKATASSEEGEKPAEWAAPVKLVVLFTLLAVIPGLMAMTTSFTRIVIVLSFVRRALATQSIPPNTVIIGMAIFLTLYTMAPTFDKINTQAIQPYLEEKMDFQAASTTAGNFMKEFMVRQTRKNDMSLFVGMAKIQVPSNPTALPFHVVVPAFIISEFRTSFEIGCLIFIPFLLLDLVVAGILLSAGMMMLPPVMISLPLKLILFILIDGWGILAQSLSLSFR